MAVSLEAVQYALRGRIDDEEADGKLTPDVVRALGRMVDGLTVNGSVVRCPAGRVGAELADCGGLAIAAGELPATLSFEVAEATAPEPGPGPQKAQKRPRKRRSSATGAVAPARAGTAVPGDPGKQSAPRDQ